MAVTFDLPQDVEQALSRAVGDLSGVAKRATLVEMYRQGRITHRDFSRALGVSRLQAEEILKSAGVTEDLPTEQEYEAALSRLRGKA